MAGSLYLGSQKVCPVVVAEKEVTKSKYGCTIDNLLGDVDSNGVLQLPSNTDGDIVFTGVTDVVNYGLAYKFSYNTNLTHGVSFPSLTTISGDYGCRYMFYNCTALTSISFSSLVTISGSNGFSSMFYGCSNLTSISFPSLTTISGSSGCGYMFYGCSNLNSVSFQSLTTISGSNGCNSMFGSCSNLTSVSFPSLTTSSFGSKKNQFSNMLNSTGTAVTHTLHFPSNLSSTIAGLDGYPNFGGTSGYVTLAFDLPTTS